MEENKNRSTQKSSEPAEDKTGIKDSKIHGRLYNSDNPAFKDRDSIDDISRVDKQEGTMNHGTTGGKVDFSNNPENQDTDKGQQ